MTFSLRHLLIALLFASFAVPALSQSTLSGQRIQPGSLPVSKILATGTASSATYLRGDGSWQSPITIFAAPPAASGIALAPLAYSGTTENLSFAGQWYSGDPGLSADWVQWQKSMDGGATWVGPDGTSATVFPGEVFFCSLGSGQMIRLRVRAENPSGTVSAWTAMTTDVSYAAPATTSSFAPAAPTSPNSVLGVLSDYAGTTAYVTFRAAWTTDVSQEAGGEVQWRYSSDGATWKGPDGTSATAYHQKGGSWRCPVGFTAGNLYAQAVSENGAGAASSATASPPVAYVSPPAPGGTTLTESLGTGANAALTTTYATLPSLNVGAATNQGVLAQGLVEFVADTSTGNDDLYAQFYDTVSGSAIAGSERHISSVPAGKRGLVTLSKYVPGSSAGRNLVLQVRNGTAARGFAATASSLVSALNITTGASTTGQSALKPASGTPLKTSGTTLISGLVLALPLNENGGTSVKDWVTNTTATLSSGWGWGTDSTGQVALVNSSSSSYATYFSNATPLNGDSTVLVLYTPLTSGSSSYPTSTAWGQGNTPGGTWSMDLDNEGSSTWLSASGTSGSLSFTASTGNVALAMVRSGGTAVAAYDLSGGSSVLLASGTMSSGSLNGTSGSNAWYIGGAYIGGTRCLQGSIKGVFIWNRALTGPERTALAADPWQMFVGY